MEEADKRKVNELVKAIKNSDDAFWELYTLMYKPILSFLRRFSDDMSTLEDIAHETFVTIKLKAKMKISYDNCYNWILTIAKHQLFKYYRKQKKIVLVADNTSQQPSDQLLRIEDGASFKFTMSKLNKEDSQLMYLKYHEDLTIKEIAKLTKQSVSTINRRLKDLKTSLEEKYGDE